MRALALGGPAEYFISRWRRRRRRKGGSPEKDDEKEIPGPDPSFRTKSGLHPLCPPSLLSPAARQKIASEIYVCLGKFEKVPHGDKENVLRMDMRNENGWMNVLNEDKRK